MGEGGVQVKPYCHDDPAQQRNQDSGLTFLPCLSAGQLTLLRFAGDVPVLRMTGEDEPDNGGKEEIESILIKVAGCIPPSHHGRQTPQSKSAAEAHVTLFGCLEALVVNSRIRTYSQKLTRYFAAK